MINKRHVKKALVLSFVALGAAGMFSCIGTGNSKNIEDLLVQGISTAASEMKEKSASTISETPQSVQVNGNTLTYGDHSYTVSGEINFNDNTTGYRGTPTASVSFTNVPSGYAEFEAVYNGLLGKSVQGTAAMIPMAIELYARDAAVGERCFNLLCNSSPTVNGIIRILKTKLVPSQYAGENDPYLQRYMAAALLKGAMASNAYTPDMPYTVEMCASANKPQNSSYGMVYYVYILAKGWDTEQRQVEVLQPNGEVLYKVFNCPSCYTQCKNIVGTWGGLK